MGGAQQPVVLFGKGHFLAFTIDLAGGGDQGFGFVFVAKLKHVVCAHDIGFQGKQGVFDNVFHAHSRRQMIHLFALGDQLVHQFTIQN